LIILEMAKVVAVLLPVAVAQFDGNPFGWDRQRRCDHIQYDPPCGPCEGVGGIVRSDQKDDIDLASCEVVGIMDESSLKRPVWGADFTVVSHEILIGKKNDVACFQAFPSNDSTAEMCYKPQEVVIYSDMRNYKALILTANQKQYIFGNVSSTIFHQGGNMWISNIILGSIRQTICTAPREGGDPTKEGVNAVQYNWTNNLFYIATEIIDVEYGVGKQTLDHWAYGPHHAWSDPSSGLIVRMWQPFNGLQIFETSTWEEGVAVERAGGLFSELSPDGSTAPGVAQPGGSLARINCAGDGFFTENDRPPVMASRVCVMNQAAFVVDLVEAKNIRTQEWLGSGDNFAVNDENCLELANVNGGVQEGDLFKVRAKAVFGKQQVFDREVQFVPGWTANFVCRGTTYDYECALMNAIPQGSTTSTATQDQPMGHALSGVADLQRARAKVPRVEYRGGDFSSMSTALNGWLLKHAPRSQECEKWSVEELQELQLRLLLLRDPQLDDVYHDAQDSRRLQRDLQTMKREWMELNKLAESDPVLAAAHRDGHCHEAVMWYVHHLPESMKVRLQEEIALPLLSYNRHAISAESTEHPAHRVGQAYDYKVTCASCHAPVFPDSTVSV